MAIFHSKIIGLSTSMIIDGRTRYFRFTPKGRPYNYGYLYVDKRNEVEGLKRHPLFRQGIISLERDDSLLKDEPPAANAPDTKPLKEYPQVTKPTGRRK